MEWTAAEILRLVREEGYRFRDIAVCARSLEGCGSLVETIFARYGVPVFLSRMSDILQKPILALITSALEAASGGYRYDDVFRYLKTGLTGLSAEDVDLLENYVLKWSLEGSAWTGARDWANHPRGVRPALLRRGTGPCWPGSTRSASGSPDPGGPAEEPGQDGPGAGGRPLRLSGGGGGAGAAGPAHRELNRRGQAALAEEYAQLWEILCGGLEQCAPDPGDAPMELDEFSKLFALVLSPVRRGLHPRVPGPGECGRHAPPGPPGLPGGVPAGGGRRGHPRRRAVAGAAQRRRPEPAGLLRAGAGPRLSDKLYREMTIVYETCALPQRRFYLSWAAAGPDGGGAAALLPPVQAEFPVPPGPAGGGGAAGRLLPPGGPPARPGAGGAVPQAGAALRALPEYAPLVERMERAARMERGRLTRPAVDALYGRRVPMSASRMDKYKSCHFSYFMQYGLKPSPGGLPGSRPRSTAPSSTTCWSTCYGPAGSGVA